MCQIKKPADRLTSVAGGTKPMTKVARDESAVEASYLEGPGKRNDLTDSHRPDPYHASHVLASLAEPNNSKSLQITVITF